jgi:hypothetical protein
MEAAAGHPAAIKYLRRYPVRSLVLRRAIILGLFSLAVASAACVLFVAAGVGLVVRAQGSKRLRGSLFFGFDGI